MGSRGQLLPPITAEGSKYLLVGCRHLKTLPKNGIGCALHSEDKTRLPLCCGVCSNLSQKITYSKASRSQEGAEVLVALLASSFIHPCGFSLPCLLLISIPCKEQLLICSRSWCVQGVGRCWGGEGTPFQQHQNPPSPKRKRTHPQKKS